MAWVTRTDNEDITFKEQILAKVRNALIEKPEAMFKDIDQRSETWVPISEEDGTAITFAQNFKEIGGIFIYLESSSQIATNNLRKRMGAVVVYQPSYASPADPSWHRLHRKHRARTEAEIGEPHRL